MVVGNAQGTSKYYYSSKFDMSHGRSTDLHPNGLTKSGTKTGSLSEQKRALSFLDDEAIGCSQLNLY